MDITRVLTFLLILLGGLVLFNICGYIWFIGDPFTKRQLKTIFLIGNVIFVFAIIIVFLLSEYT